MSEDFRDILGERGGTAFRVVDPISLHYLSCHRTGAMDIYQKNMAVQDESMTNSLLDQVNYWLNYIVGTVLRIHDLKKRIICR